MEVLFYRDARSTSKFTVAVAKKDGTVIQGPFTVNQNWQLATMVKGY